MRNLTRAAMILATAVLAGGVGAGCGGDDDSGSGGDLTTGLAESKLLSDVTAEEAQSACENLATGFEAKLSQDRIIRSFCTLFGAVIADTPGDCETQRDQCIEQAESGQGEVADAADFAPECDGTAELSQCQGTVGQLETCANDMIDTVLNLLDSFTCADAASLGEEDLDGLGGVELTPPASCEALECGDGGPFGGGDE